MTKSMQVSALRRVHSFQKTDGGRVDRLRETRPSAGVSVRIFRDPYWGMAMIRIAFRGKRYKAAS
jgi:hypothetical protein